VKETLIARNYADALLAVAEQERSVERYGELLETVAGAVSSEPRVVAVLMSPRVTKRDKQRLLARALGDVAPGPFVRFLQALVQRGRQGLLDPISEAYGDLADQHYNRAHASVLTARPVDEELRRAIAERLSEAVGRSVVPHFRTDPSIIGGVVVRVGDRAFDGSIRRRIQVLRNRMLRGSKAGQQ
jgi:F-type H+-transporting ATPase subunit delta